MPRCRFRGSVDTGDMSAAGVDVGGVDSLFTLNIAEGCTGIDAREMYRRIQVSM